MLFLLKKKPSESEFDGWISQYHGALYKHALWMTGNQDIALDMTQEAFYQAWMSRRKLKDKDKALPWLLTILRRTVYREQRYQYRHAETMKTLSEMNLEQHESDASSLLEIYYVFEGLTPKLRDTFLLYQLHGYSYEEISEQLEIPVGTVMSRISRARDALKRRHDLADQKVIDIGDVKRGSGSE